MSSADKQKHFITSQFNSKTQNQVLLSVVFTFEEKMEAIMWSMCSSCKHNLTLMLKIISNYCSSNHADFNFVSIL